MDQNTDRLVSVVMSVYNGEMYLAEAIESVLQQTYKNLEFIIVDDGSTDRSAEIVKDYQARDKRIVLVTQKNAGIPAALNAGIQKATSEIIVRMDADDILFPNRLEKQLAFFFTHPEATVVSCSAFHINGKGERIGKSGLSTHLQTVEQCKEIVAKGGILFCLHPGAIFWKKPVLEIGGYDERLQSGEDVDLWNRLAEKGYYLIIMPERLMNYRIHGSAFTSSVAFRKKWDYLKWIFTNIHRRRAGQAELSFQEFLESKRKESALKKWNDLRVCYGAIVDRNSAVLYGEGKYLNFLFYLMACMALRPRLTLLRLKTHLS